MTLRQVTTRYFILTTKSILSKQCQLKCLFRFNRFGNDLLRGNERVDNDLLRGNQRFGNYLFMGNYQGCR